MKSRTKRKLTLDLMKAGAIKFGQFKLKSGIMSPYYIDLRVLTSHPELLQDIAMAYCVILSDIEFDLMAGVAYAALPLVGAISFLNKRPWIYKRKEIKTYGTKQSIEGKYTSGQKVIVIDDLITSGLSKFEVIEPLEEEGLIVNDVVVLIDREQGGKRELAKKHYKLHSILTFSEILAVLLEEKKIKKISFNKIKKFISDQ